MRTFFESIEGKMRNELASAIDYRMLSVCFIHLFRNRKIVHKENLIGNLSLPVSLILFDVEKSRPTSFLAGRGDPLRVLRNTESSLRCRVHYFSLRKHLFGKYLLLSRSQSCAGLVFKKMESLFCPDDPDLAPEFSNFCDYYNTLGYAVEPGKSRHKALVENAVKQFQDRILNHLNKRSFFSIEEINSAIEPLLVQLNKSELIERPGSSRFSRYKEEERNLLRPLPLIEYSAHSKVMSRKVRPNNQIRLGNVRYNVPWGYVGKELLVKVDTQIKEISFIDPSDGEILTTTKIRNPSDGPEPQRKELIPQDLKYLVENKEELLDRIRVQLGDKAWEVAKRLAKPNNSMAVRHLKGFLSLSKKYEKDFMDKVYEDLLKKTIISFKGYRDALQKVEQIEGVRYKKKRLKHGATLDVIDCRSVRGAEYYKDRFNQ